MAAILLVLIATAGSVGYEEGMPNLVSPYSMEPGKSEFQVQHRFLGEAFDDMIDDFFGADLGANISLSLRSFVTPGVEIDLSHIRAGGEYTAGGGYNGFIGAIQSSFHISGHWYTVEVTADDRESGFYGLLSLETMDLGDVASITANLGWDSREERTGLGFGASAALSGAVSLQGEYWPARDGAEGFEADSMDAWCAGLRMNTWGHQFGMVFGNSWAVGTRNLPAGATDDEIRLGVTIRRQISL